MIFNIMYIKNNGNILMQYVFIKHTIILKRTKHLIAIFIIIV